MRGWILLFQSVCWFLSTITTTTNHVVLVSSFSTTPTIPKATTTTTSSLLSMSSQQSPPINILEQLSVDAVSGIQESHRLGHEIGCSVLRNEVLFAGLVSLPEGARITLDKFDITPPKVATSATKQLQNQPNLELSPSQSNDPLPFSSATKIVLTKAADISISMGSKEIRSEHVILALMGYNLGDRIESSPVLSVLTNIKPTIKALNGGSFSVFQFCEQLVQDLKNNVSSSDDTFNPPRRVVAEREEIVVGGGGLGGIGMQTLSSVGVDMTQMALDGELDPVFGRDQEIRSALRTLGRRRKNNPCLIGEPGVGKTAVAEAIAQVLATSIETDDVGPDGKKKFKFQLKLNPFANKKKEEEKEEELIDDDKNTDIIIYELPTCPTSLTGARLIRIELASLVAGTANRGDFEQKVQNLIKEASNANVILFIDEIHTIIGTGGDGAMNAANLFKPALARGELRILGATTTPEYRRYIEKDGALERRFQPLMVEEPSIDETIDILTTILPRYEEFHGVEYTSNAIEAAAKLSARYVNDRFLPDKAIDLCDEAGSMVKQAIYGDNILDDDTIEFVTEDSITQVISELSGIPVGKLDVKDKERLIHLEDELQQRIKGQESAVTAVAKSIRRSRAGLADIRRPVASFLFCGSTGVGKTELCKAVASTYYGNEQDMIRLDMSEYMDRFSTSRLVGAPPGYVGFEEGGQLTEAVRRKPHSVILFDEMEKAHPDVLNILLQILDEGTLTDGKGRTVNFKNTILVMTSNIGSQKILEAQRGGDNNKETTVDSVVQNELEQALRPEFLNRIDEIIIFNPLSYDVVQDIGRNMMNEVVERATTDGPKLTSVTISDNVLEIITRQGFSRSFGARPIRRSIKRYLEDTLAEALLTNFLHEGDSVSIDLVPPETDRVKLTTGQGKTLVVKVDPDTGIGGNADNTSDAKWDRLYGQAPSLDDDDMEREVDEFQ